MNCHIVPQTYLKSWKIAGNKQSIYVINKKNIKDTKICNISNLSNTNFAKEDEFIIDFERFKYNYNFKEELRILYEELKDLTIEYNNGVIDSFKKFKENIYHITNFVYKNKISGKNENTEKINHKLKCAWDIKISKNIEDFFNIYLENNWNTFLSYINDILVNKKTWKVDPLYKDYITEFILIQRERRRESTEYILEEFMGIIDNMFDNTLQNSHKEELKVMAWMMQLYRYKRYKVDNQTDFKENTISKTIEVVGSKMQIYYIFPIGKLNFITSDNPCFLINLGSKYNKIYTGIYFHITPKVCAYVTISPENILVEDKYLLLNARDNTVKYINNLILENSYVEVAHNIKDIEHLISKKPDDEGWEGMFKDIGLQH